MTKTLILGLVLSAVLVIVVSFFMPWAEVSGSVGDVAKGFTGVFKDFVGETSLGAKVIGKIEKATDVVSEAADVRVKSIVRGVDVPKLVNAKSSKIAISLAQVMFKSVEGLEWKSYAVYLFPLAGIFCGIMAWIGLKHKVAISLMTGLSGAIAGAGLYNVYTADLSGSVVKVKIDQGIWHSLYAFLFISIMGIVWTFVNKKDNEKN